MMGLLGKAPVKYRYQGRDPATGMDCWGLLDYLYRSLGIDIPDHVRILQESKGDQEVYQEALDSYAEMFRTIEPGEVTTGDVLLFHEPGSDNHVGVVISPKWTAHIHNSEGGGVVKKATRKLLRLKGTKVKRYVGSDSDKLGR